MTETHTERYQRIAREVLEEAIRVSWFLFKVMIPVVIIVKILEELGAIRHVAAALAPIMAWVGLPGATGIVWATAMLTNLYAGTVAFVSLGPAMHLTVAQVTILTAMMLVAHNLPVELRVAQKAGTRLVTMAVLRIGGALVFGALLNLVYRATGTLQYESVPVLKAPPAGATLPAWALGQVKNLVTIFVVILALMALLRVLRRLKVVELLERLLAPVLRFLGMTPAATDITIVGMTLGLAYGGGLIIRHATSGRVSRRDVFFSLSLMGLCHSLIEDTAVMALLGGHLSGILFGRIAFALIAIFSLSRLCDRLSPRLFGRYLCEEEVRAKM